MHPLVLLALAAVVIAIVLNLPAIGPAGFAAIAVIVAAFFVPWLQPE